MRTFFARTCCFLKHMGGWVALCVLLLRLACQARPAAAALELGYWPKGPPNVVPMDNGVNVADIGVQFRTDPDYPDRSSPFVIAQLTMDNWWKEAVDDVLVLPKGHPLGRHTAVSPAINIPTYFYTDSNGKRVINTTTAQWALSDDLTLRVQVASPEKAHRIGELAGGPAC